MNKKSFFVTLSLACATLVKSQVLSVPFSNHDAGAYTTIIELSLSHELPGVSIFYTLNGDEPTVADFLYSGPISLDTHDGEPDNISTVPTNPSLVYPFGSYSAARAATRGWVPPYMDGYKVNVVRYKAFKPGYAPSQTVTQTFIIDPEGAARYTMPIVSVNMDYNDLFSDESGIYVYGDHEEGNYEQKGSAWERIMSLEYFNTDGTLGFAQDCRTRIHGGGSRHAPKKSFRIYAETGDITNFKYPFFDDTELEKFKRLLLKAGGHRPDCFPRDDLGNMITKGLNVEQQHFRHVIVFVNGEYWGVHSLKERMDNYFFQNLYGIDDNDITLLDQEYDIQGNGSPIDSAKMKNLEGFVDVNDMNDPANYAYVSDRIDIENYIDYMASEIFLSNEDWVYSNVNIWRKTGDYDPTKPAGQNGKFRWAIYDLDGAFGGACSNAFYTVNTLASATIEAGPFSSYSRFFRGMLGSDEFKLKFINRMSDLTNSWFKSDVVSQKIDSIYNILTPEIYENAVRWRYPSFASTIEARYDEVPSIDRWNELFDLLQIFASRRQRKIREHIMLKWGYADTNKLEINVNDIEMGRVQVNSILINKNLPGVTAGLYPWIGDYIDGVALPLIAVPLPGYRFVEWSETGETNDTITWMPDGDASYTAIFESDPTFLAVRINELMPSNTAYLEDNFGENDDWLELYNPNTYPVNLSGSSLRLGDREWVIPNGFIIPANDYKLFWHDNETYQGPNHVSFKLPNAIDTVWLISPQGTELDFVRYPTTPTDNSYGRYPNGSNTFANFSYPTPLANNDLAGANEEIKILTPLSVYPNPSREMIYFNKTVSFQLFDLNGKIVLQHSNVSSVDVSSLNSGIYLLHTSTGETVKINIQ